MVIAYMKDALTQGQTDPAQTGLVHIIDLGAGSGQFAFHFLKKLEDLYRNSSLHQKIAYRYVVADFAKANIEFCRNHPAMQPFIKSGVLDFALIDATEPQSLQTSQTPLQIKLLQSGDVLESGKMPGAMVLIGNYLFDSLPQDLFYLNGQLYECLPKLSKNEYKNRDEYKDRCRQDPGKLPEV